MFLRSFVKNNLLFRIMDPLKRKSPVATLCSKAVILLQLVHCYLLHVCICVCVCGGGGVVYSCFCDIVRS